MGKVDQRQKGASAVEFAVIAPLFITLLFAIVEFGMVLYTQGMMTHAAREGARYGVVFSNPRRSAAEIRSKVQEYLNLSGLTNDSVVTVTGAGGSSGDNLDVRVDYTYKFLVMPQEINHFIGKMADLNLRVETVMRME